MNEDFEKNFNNDEVGGEEIIPETVNEEIPQVEAEKVEEEKDTSYRSQQTYYGYTQSSEPQYGSSYRQSNPQPAYYAYSRPQPMQTPNVKKEKKGLKVFASAIALILVFALGFGASTIMKYSDKDNAFSSSDDKKINSDGPALNINESPVTPTKISSSGVLSTAQIAAKLRPSNVGIVVYTRNSNSSAGEGSGNVES